MSLTQLQAELTGLLPRWDSRRVKRDARSLKLKTRKLIRSNLRRSRSQAIAAYRRQYFLSHAYADMKGSIARNEDIFITSVIIALVLGFSTAATILDLLIVSFGAAYVLSDLSGIDMGFFLFVAGAALGLIGAWLMAFVMNLQAIAIMEGATRKQHRSIRSTVRRSLAHAGRVTGAWLLAFIGIFGVPALLGATALSYAELGARETDQVFASFPYLATAAIAWIVVAALQFALAPFVALFEPNVRLRRVLHRSAALVKRRGHLFIMASYGLLALVLAGAYLLAGGIEQLIGLHQGLQFFTYAFIIAMFYNGIMATLYRKRKLARSN